MTGPQLTLLRYMANGAGYSSLGLKDRVSKSLADLGMIQYDPTQRRWLLLDLGYAEVAKTTNPRNPVFSLGSRFVRTTKFPKPLPL